MRMCIWCLMMYSVTSDEDVQLVFDDVRCRMNGSTSDEDVYLVCDDGRFDF